ncbi:UDP-glycosyltransferase 73B4 [Striga hermonthica]|uniref:UDP-glycosyltransferase 73B4 n=1 Tax=Striga hermonthica TaxID=68872 RepID=A0A9N7RGV0_STRHE|nr:UDP-glycosyltransferase 73B4 [Striga hermonthica]
MATLITNPQNQTQPSSTTMDHHVAVIVLPFPAQGHLNQLLQLSCLVSSYGVPVHYVAPPVFSRQAQSRANDLINPHDLQKIHFHDIPTPHFDSPPPNPDSSHRFPTHLLPAWYACLSLREPFSAFLLDLSKKFTRVVIIHDPMMAFVVQDIGSVPNAESWRRSRLGSRGAGRSSYGWSGMPTHAMCLADQAGGSACRRVSRKGWRGWAPQPRILDHEAVGGFVSHCGWNSCVESIVGGVAVAAWPMHADQPANATLVVGVLGMGIVVNEWAGRAELVRAEAVEDAVRRLMGPGEGERVRRRAEDVGKMVRAATKKGGSSRLEMDSFIAHINRM